MEPVLFVCWNESLYLNSIWLHTKTLNLVSFNFSPSMCIRQRIDIVNFPISFRCVGIHVSEKHLTLLDESFKICNCHHFLKGSNYFLTTVYLGKSFSNGSPVSPGGGRAWQRRSRMRTSKDRKARFQKGIQGGS